MHGQVGWCGLIENGGYMKRLTVVTLLSILISLPSAQANQLLERAEGKWELSPNERDSESTFTCSESPLEIFIDVEKMRYTSIREKYTDTAVILEVGDGHFWIRYDGEERLDKDGKPVEWAWVAEGTNQFFWVRRDWLNRPGARTASRVRCLPDDNLSS